MGVENLPSPLGFDPQTAQPVVSRYTDCAILARLYFFLKVLYTDTVTINVLSKVPNFGIVGEFYTAWSRLSSDLVLPWLTIR